MLTFGLIAYEIAHDSAIEKEKHLLKGIVKVESSYLASHFKRTPSLDNLQTYLSNGVNSDHLSLLLNNNGPLLIPALMDIENHHQTFPLKKILTEKTPDGQVSIDGKLYLWVKLPISGSPYDLIHIFRSSYQISTPFSSLAARLVAVGIFILWVAVWVALIISTAVTRRLKAQNDALEHQALHDSLTDLPNRTLLHNRLEYAIKSAKRDKHQVALIMMDLDRFKEINDTLGHHIGDLLLQQVGIRLTKNLKKTDTISRFGGDEFAILLPKAELSHARLVANRIIKALHAPFQLEDSSIEIDASFGVALYPQHANDCTTLILRADVAMHLAKSTDNEFAIYDQDKDPHSLARLTLTGDLRHATEHNEMVLYYQPKVDIKTGFILGVEALMRWQHPQLGQIKPDEFIPLAEQTGMIKSLTLWSLRAAVKQCALLHQANYPITVSVNLSASILQDLQVPSQVMAILNRHNLPPRYLELEITETTIMKDPQQALDILTRLNHLGVRLSIDDFGTGYTCLSYLKQLPVDEIKIDKSFVVNMLNDENDAMIVRSIVDLAHNMGHKVTAEGVETLAILASLKEQQCDKAQGFYFSPPIPYDELEQLLASSMYGATKNIATMLRPVN